MSDNKINVSLEEMLPLMTEQLGAGGEIRFMPRGTSMLPLIRQGVDTVVISPARGNLKKYDIPLYKRTDGHFVLHRVVGTRDGKYIMCGDNQHIKEYGITNDQIIGVLTKVIKPEGEVSVSDKKYIGYSKRRVAVNNVKCILYKLKFKLGKLKKRIVKG